MRIGKHETHPASDMFPLLAGPELDELAKDVKSYGLRSPIVLYEERILDGRNRYLACEKAGVEPRFETFEGSDPVAYVLSHNLHRRHLDASQRAIVAARARSLFEERAALRRRATQNNDAAQAVPANLQEQGEATEKAAELMKVSARSVYHAQRVLEAGAPEVVRAVEGGTLAISTAATIVELPREQQVDLMTKNENARNERVRELRRRPRPTPPSGFIGPSVREDPPGHAFETFEEIPEGNYFCLYMNPPWEYLDGHFAGTQGRRPVTEEQLGALDLGRICKAQGAHLWLWTTWWLIRERVPQRLLKKWGFRWESELVWRRESPSLSGHWLRPVTEVLILASRGALGCRDEKTLGYLDAPPDVTGKPPSVRDVIGRCSAGPRIELFARTLTLPGWDVFGPELVLVREPVQERAS